MSLLQKHRRILVGRLSGYINTQPERPVAIVVFEAGKQFAASRAKGNKRQRQ